MDGDRRHPRGQCGGPDAATPVRLRARGRATARAARTGVRHAAQPAGSRDRRRRRPATRTARTCTTGSASCASAGCASIFRACKTVEDLATAARFLHWELNFADVFARRGGFDLVLGNPPWIKVEWKEAGILGEKNPLFAIRKFSASDLGKLRDEAFSDLSRPAGRLDCGTGTGRSHAEFSERHAELSTAQGHANESVQVLPAAGLAAGWQPWGGGLSAPRRAV